MSTTVGDVRPGVGDLAPPCHVCASVHEDRPTVAGDRVPVRAHRQGDALVLRWARVVVGGTVARAGKSPSRVLAVAVMSC
ncbi:hypothetical protein [Prescottella equi]|uniref:hypothetical protein n=1 Tax=Rhodococcus hoagii TaxID=43767 RepID=UPI001EDE51CD|nr:hypothetical protein [Prescottella equi]